MKKIKRLFSRHLLSLAICTSVIASAVGGALAWPHPALAANPATMNFQGKVVNADGTNVTNGSYSFIFRIYDSASPVTTGSCASNTSCWWEETDTLTVTNGVFQVELGATCAFSSACNSSHSGVNFATNNVLYLTLKFNNDSAGFMSPTVHLTSVPYAFNADNLGGISASGFIQNNSGSAQASTNFHISGTGIADTALQAPSFDTSVANGNLNIGTGNAGAITIGSVSKSTVAVELKTSTTAFQVQNSTGDNLLTIDTQNSFIGVGTGTPSARLHIAGSDPTSRVLAKIENVDTGSGTAGTALQMVSGTRDWTFGTDAGLNGGNNFFLQDNVAGYPPRLLVDTNGNLVINGDTPGAKLDVQNVGGSTIGLKVAASSVPAADLVSISNTGQAVTANNVNGLSVNYVGGNAAVESSGIRMDLTPGGTSGGTWSGLRIVANATGPASGVTEYGIKLEGPSSAGAGTTTGLYVATGWDIGLAIESGGIELAAQNNPAVPASGQLRVYAKTIAGRTMLKAMGSSGIDYPLQPSFFQNNIVMINAQSGSNVNLFGTNKTLTGTTSTPNASEQFGYMTNWATAATAASDAGVSTNPVQFFRGTQIGANGFFFQLRGAIPDDNVQTNGARIFVGMTSQTTSTSVSSDNPSGDRAGFSYSSVRGDTDWMFSTKDNSTENLIDTGLSFQTSSEYDWYVYTPAYPNNGTIYWRIDNLTAGTTQEGSTTAHLPRGQIAMRASIGIETEAAAVNNIRMQRMYIESDQ